MVLLAATAPSAHADLFEGVPRPKDATAVAHLSAGSRAFKADKFEDAIKEYQAGIEREDVAIFYYDLGQCYRALGRHADAIRQYKRFLTTANLGLPLRTRVQGFIDDEEAKLKLKEPTEPATDEHATCFEEPAGKRRSIKRSGAGHGATPFANRDRYSHRTIRE